jgi:hypothetical protein
MRESVVLRLLGYRLYFVSREGRHPHVHVQHSTGEAKFWLEPRVELARNYGLTETRVAGALRIVREHAHEVQAAWQRHFLG